MFDVHRKGTDFLFEIPDSLMGRDILIVNKISGVPYALNDAGVNKGMGYGEKIVRFRKDTLYKKVWVMTYDPRITSPEGDRITRSVRDNYRETAIEQFPIDAYGKDFSASVVIKVNKGLRRQRKEFQQRFRLHRTARFAQEGPFEDRIRRIVPLKTSSSNRSSRPRTPRRARRSP